MRSMARLLEQIRLLRAGGFQPEPNIVRHFAVFEPVQATLDGDTLPQLAQTGLGELGFQLRLADENDLEQLFRRRLQIREQAKVLQDVRLEILSLVDQQHARAAPTKLLDEEGVERLDALESSVPLHLDVQFVAGVSEQLLEAQRGVVNVGEPDRSLEILHQHAEERRLARADLARHDDEALALLDTRQEARIRFPVHRICVEEPRVRRDVEGFLSQTEVCRVHGAQGSAVLSRTR